MLAQTNLQLYRQLIDAGWGPSDLALVREAYDLSRELFAGCFRPNHKAFICHLTGTASALASWGASAEQVAAGLLHSSYLYGDFGDGTWGLNGAKRKLLRARMGSKVEGLVEEYTRTDHLVLQEVAEARETGQAVQNRDAAQIRLADLCDECLDGGPCYSPDKPLAFGLPARREGRDAVLHLAGALVGPVAVAQFQASFELFDTLHLPADLHSPDLSFHALKRKARGYPRGRLLGLVERVFKRLRGA